MLRFCVALSVLVISFSSLTMSSAQDDTASEKLDANKRIGISDVKPDEGHFAELPDGTFMVPYTTSIPGTDVEFEMVPIPGGKFKIGSPEDEEGRNSDEGPQVEIVVQPFWMGKYEVTWGEYRNFMALDELFKAFNGKGIREVTEDRKIDAVTAPSGLYDPTFTFDGGDGPRNPAATMTQLAAKQYTKWLSQISGDFYRLPSEAEWEYACRAGTTTAYYFGDDPSLLEDHAWFDDNADLERHDVGELKANPWGLYDIYGNVAEWVLDAYDEDGYGKLEEDSKEKTAGRLAVNWPIEVFPRTVRGGSWEMMPEECRSASRLASHDVEWKKSDPNLPASPWWFTTEPATGVGFRLIRPLNAPETREGKELFWEADHPTIERAIRVRIETYGKGSWGLADPDLPNAMKKDDR